MAVFRHGIRLLFAFVLLAMPLARALAAAAEPPPSASLSGTDADADRTMEGLVGLHSQELISKWLRANPRRDLTLHLDSRGGLAKFGAILYDAIEAHGRVATVVDAGQACLSSCAYLWLAGNTRTLADRAVLGFHSAACAGPCDPRGIGVVNQSILDILARTEPLLAVQVSNTGVMMGGKSVIALARRENGRWVMRTFQPPTTTVAAAR